VHRHLTDYLEQHAKTSPAKLALVTDDASLTWQELWRRVEPVANLFNARLSSDEQQVVAILMPNTWQYVVAYLAIIHAGHIALPVDVIYKPLEIDAVIQQVPPALVITDRANKNRIASQVAEVLTFEELTASTPPPDKLQPLRLPADEQIASLFFTSGTTGKPKAAPNTHANHIWNIKTCSKVWNWTADDSQLTNVRLSHMIGLVMGLSGTLYHGSTMYLQDRFNAENTLRMLASGKITMFSHGPLVYAQLLEVPNRDKYDLSKVRLFISGSGPLPPPVWQKFKNVFGAEILEVYGSTETGRITSNLLDERIPGSPGRPLPGVNIKLSKTGEILVKSPGVFPGYWRNLPATKKASATDGYWRTGDIGELKDGRLILRGRTQEIIRKKGYTVSPRDVEWALHKSPGIKEVLVMGVPEPGNPDDRIVYFVVGEIKEDDLHDFCKTNLPSVWRADRIIKLDKLPTRPNGKPELAKLKAMVQESVGVKS